MMFSITKEGWVDATGRYRVTRDEDPWWHPDSNEEPHETWTVSVRKWGNSWNYLYRAADFDGAVFLAESDADRPVFNEDGECRWCGTEENYLTGVPSGWFGCRLCDPNPREESDDLTWQDVEDYDDPS